MTEQPLLEKPLVEKPLRGRRIVVTRARAQAESLCEWLLAAGAQPLRFPTIETYLEDEAALRRALAQMQGAKWIIFTSARAVEAFVAAGAHTRDQLPTTRVAAVGPATAAALRRHGLAPDWMPSKFTGAALAHTLDVSPGDQLLLPRARVGNTEIVDILRARGVHVEDIPLYVTRPGHPSPQEHAALAAGVDALLFTSPSTVYNFCQLYDGAAELLAEAVSACIGPTTSAAATEMGAMEVIVPEEHTVDALLSRLRHHYESRERHASI